MKLSAVVLVVFLAVLQLLVGQIVEGPTASALTDEFSRNVQTSDSPFHNVNTSLTPIEEQDAIAVEYIIVQSLKSVKLSVRIVSNLIRIIADTAAGALSTVVKGFGGIANLLSRLLGRFSNYLQNSSTVFGQRSSISLNRVSVILNGVGDSCIYGGDIIEEVTRGMGEALQDSFGKLEVVTNSIRYLVVLLLGRSHPPLPTLEPPITQHKYTQEEYNDIFKQQNTLYGHNRQWKDQTTVEDEDDDISDHSAKSSLNKMHNKGNKHNEKQFSKLKNAEDLQGLQSNAKLDWIQTSEQFFSLLQSRLISFYNSMSSEASKHLSIPNANSLDVPSIGPYLLFGLLLMCIVNLIEYSSTWWRLLTILISICILWYQIMSVEHSQRLRLVQRTSVKSIHSYLTRQTSLHSTNISNSNSTALRRSSRASYRAKPVPYENAVWLNVMMNALWNIDGAQGLGQYVSSIYEEMLATELSKITPGIADIRLKNFDLGTHPPLVKGIRMRSTRDKQCVANILKLAQLNLNEDDKDGQQYQKYVESLISFLSAKKGPPILSRYARKGQSLNQKHSLTECDEIDLDLDFIYASQDMNIVMSMRHEDSKSVLPEMSVTLSELFLAGQITFAMKLTPDYPFLGNATVFFIEHPSLDFRVSSVGGVDVSAIPMGFEFMNTTLNWMLSEYTAPYNTTLDVRHTICPSCDSTPVLTTQELVVKALIKAQQMMITTAEKAGEWIQDSTEVVQQSVYKFKPTVKRIQLASLKLLDAAAVKIELLSQRMNIGKRNNVKRISSGFTPPLIDVSTESYVSEDDVKVKRSTITGWIKWTEQLKRLINDSNHKQNSSFHIDDLWY